MVGTGVLARPIAYLNGMPTGVMEAVEPQRKGMAVTRSFGTSVRQCESLMGAVAPYAKTAGEKLR